MSKNSDRKQAIQDFILQNLRNHPQDIVSLTVSHFNISRQSVWKHVHALVAEEKIYAFGSTKNTRYELAPMLEFNRTYPIDANSAEDKVWRSDIAPLLKDLPKNIYAIYQYGFTEIFNNAIDHSEGTQITIDLNRYPDQIHLAIKDNGVGIFNKIKRDNQLDDPIHAILELSKGKLTTDPEHHSGEGIFFSSRMFDSFYILSGGLTFNHDDQSDIDLVIESKQDLPGTSVLMEISPTSTRTTKQIFDQFTIEKDVPLFDRTIVPVSLARYGDENLISRSQAKRLLTRFDRFKEVVLDFNKVDLIGQAFADEVFRVYQKAHPNVHLSYMRANPEIISMIERVQNN